ncbi:MAG: exodeoxyribonuclease VII small subunit [Bacteroidetes bacterium]|nr:exodeoxyribonuclease VII small subunit [Bacteroidota bacterium]MBL6943240.1 exodeoxyribonuclease VII small subunit [Bacteroidales bacterium]
MKKEITYSEAIEELEKIVSIIENEAVNIDELSAKVKRAAELINVCKDKLHNTEEEVNRILKDING